MLLSPSRQLGELLVERKVLSRDQLAVVLEQESASDTPLSAILLAEGLVAEKDLVAAVATQLGIPFVDLAQQIVRPDLASVVPARMAVGYRAVPVDIEDGILLVAIQDPGNEAALKELASATGYEIRAAIAERRELEATLTRLYPDEMADSGVASDISSLHVNELLLKMLELDGSDLHLSAGTFPMARVHGDVVAIEGYGKLSGSEIRRMVYEVLTQKQRERFEDELELDTSHSIPGHGRFRINVMQQRNAVGAVMRAIPHEVIPLEALGMPAVIEEFTEIPRGLVLVTGPTGSGKSTTLASMIDIINEQRRGHIITVEDPIEFVHTHKGCIVNQREVGEDTNSFSHALKHMLRQDPDVILVGELRDLETIATALTAAETGHLVFATLHTQDAPQSVDRIIDVFPSEQQQQVRIQLASTLQAVMTQQLVPLANNPGRAVATEVLVVTPAVRNLIREGKTYQIYSAMQAGGRYGMQTMDQSLASLVVGGQITMNHALERCVHPDDLKKLAGQA